MFYVYIPQSPVKDRLNIGKTINLKRRVSEHNAGQNVFTQGQKAIRRMLKSYFDKSNKIHFEYQGSTT